MNKRQLVKPEKTVKILFFPDKIGGEDSGARSARVTLKTLIELGYDVAIYTADADKIQMYQDFKNILYYKVNSVMRANAHFFEAKLVYQFKNILNDFKPDYFFMAGGIQKPSILAKIARKKGIKNIFLFYITDYYCAKVYAGLKDGPCYKCIDKNSLQALSKKCITGKLKYFNFIKGYLVRILFKNEILKSYRVVGYSDDQINTYKKLGVEYNKCLKISLQFNPNELNNYSTKDGEYFLVLGQPVLEKGWHTLSTIFSMCKTTPNIRIVFKNKDVEEKIIRDFNLTSFKESGMIATDIEVVKREDIINIIANARAIIIPSYYPTTGEFVLIESLILGKPVMLYNVGAHNDFITHRQNGMVANVGDFEKFAKNIDEININPELRMKLSDGSKKLIGKLISDEHRLNSLKKLFQ